MFEEYAEHEIATYAGYIINNDDLLECTSGGIATALSKKVLEEGGCVAGVSYSNDFLRAQYEIIYDVKDLDKFRGSKYIEVDKGTIYKDVKRLLDEGKTVLFFGLPCVVAAMKSFLQKDYKNLVTVELICHGPTSIKVHQQYIEHLEKKYHSKVIDFSVRKKVEGAWTPPYLYAKFANGKSYLDEFYHTEYGYAFSVMSSSSCYNCQFRGNARVGDIMIGDFWGATESDEFWNKGGISAILVHTILGNTLLKSTEGIKLYETSFEKIVRSNLNIVQTRNPSSEKEKFEKLFEKYGLFYAAKHSKSLKTKVKNCMIQMIPSSIKPFTKKIYHMIKKKA